MPLYQYQCKVCHEKFEKFKSVAHRNDVYCCNVKAYKLISQVYTHPDLAYSGVTELFGKPRYINSKGEFKTLLKQHNLADASMQECKQQAGKMKRWRDEDDQIRYKKTADEILKSCQKDNVEHVARDAIKKVVQGGIKESQKTKGG